jgi:hypothetical protein
MVSGNGKIQTISIDFFFKSSYNKLMSKDKVTLKIPRPLYERLSSIISESGFSSVNEFVVYVLRDLVSLGLDDQKELTKEETEAIKKRLKTLGYF